MTEIYLQFIFAHYGLYGNAPVHALRIGPFLEAVETTFGRSRAKEAALVPPRLGTPPQIHDHDPHATDRGRAVRASVGRVRRRMESPTHPRLAETTAAQAALRRGGRTGHQVRMFADACEHFPEIAGMISSQVMRASKL